MRLRILSDLHLEIESSYRYESCGEDVVLCAGDISSWPRRDLASRFFASIRVPVFYCLGNHDYYHGIAADVVRWNEGLRNRHPNLHFLHNRTEKFRGYTIAGSPLWTDFRLFGDQVGSMVRAGNAINDFRVTSTEDGMLAPDTVLDWHNSARSFLQREIEGAAGPVIVLTHWLPSERTIDTRYAGDPLNAYFSACADALIRPPVVLWVHGHSHGCFDREIDGVRLLRNPRGYAGHEETGWNPELVIELPD